MEAAGEFVLVNDRTPRSQSFCALCCESIGGNYLREIATRLSYCDHKCYVGRQKLATPAFTEIVRRRHHVVETQSALSTCRTSGFPAINAAGCEASG